MRKLVGKISLTLISHTSDRYHKKGELTGVPQSFVFYIQALKHNIFYGRLKEWVLMSAEYGRDRMDSVLFISILQWVKFNQVDLKQADTFSCIPLTIFVSIR